MKFRDDNERLEVLSIFSSSSLTDIVLLLLIFFLLTSSFVTNFGIKVNVPKAETGAETQPNFIGVTITKDGEYYVAGNLVSEAMLASAIREQRRENPNSTLVLRADKDAVVDDAVRVMNIGKALNLRIVMATERGSR
ncbi:MAG: ExbD/TolR family protein [Bacteroidota bacterium]